MPRLIAIILAGLLSLMSAGAAAETAPLAEARRLVEEQDYNVARRTFARALTTGTLEPEEMREVYSGLAECNAALRHPVEARDAFIRLLLLDPDHYVPSDASPLVREPFVQAQAFWSERGQASFDWSPPSRISPDEPFTIDLGLPIDAFPALLSHVELSLWSLPDGGSETLDLEEGRIELTAEQLEDVEQLELAITIFDENGNVVTRFGSPETPLTVDVAEAIPGEQNDGESAATGRRRLYQRWWFWAILGAVVVGTAVAIPVGLSATDSGDPCSEALGGPCDLHLEY